MRVGVSALHPAPFDWRLISGQVVFIIMLLLLLISLL